jgi:hypothetical protein
MVPTDLYSLLLDRIGNQEDYRLAGFLSYRLDRTFAHRLLERRPDLLERLNSFAVPPIAEDSDARLLAQLHGFGLLPEELRQSFVECVREAATEDADASVLRDSDLRAVLSEEELGDILAKVQEEVLDRIPYHVSRVRREWGTDYPPEDHFDALQSSISIFAEELYADPDESEAIERTLIHEIGDAIAEMQQEYKPSVTASAPTGTETAESPLAQVFRDVDL